MFKIKGNKQKLQEKKMLIVKILTLFVAKAPVFSKKHLVQSKNRIVAKKTCN